MGACASAPKVLKDGDRAAPTPEQPQEDHTAAGSKVEAGENEKKAQENEIDEETTKSLATLLSTKEETGEKESAETEKKTHEPETTPPEPKAEIVPEAKSDKPAADQEKKD